MPAAATTCRSQNPKHMTYPYRTTDDIGVEGGRWLCINTYDTISRGEILTTIRKGEYACEAGEDMISSEQQITKEWYRFMFFRLVFFYWVGWDLPPDVAATSNWQCVNSKVCKSVYLWFCFKCVWFRNIYAHATERRHIREQQKFEVRSFFFLRGYLGLRGSDLDEIVWLQASGWKGKKVVGVRIIANVPNNEVINSITQIACRRGWLWTFYLCFFVFTFPVL